MPKYNFYYKPNRTIVPHTDETVNRQAEQKLKTIFENKSALIPRLYREQWDKVALYHPTGDLEKANAILINSEDGAYDLGNKINDLTGKEWTKFTSSWFIFNALSTDLKQEKELDSHIEDHPATFSPTMISDFIRFFTKEGMTVLDPFCGIGSTMEACKRTNRIGFATELNPKYYNLILKRTPEFKNNIFNSDAVLIPTLNISNIDFCISSPPYWDILNRSTKDFESKRTKRQLDVNYSDTGLDLGNIADYEKFLAKLTQIYLNIYKVLRNNAYVVIIIKNVKKGGQLYPLAWDLAKRLSEKYVMKDEKIWIQDKVGLAPYGYPFSWASNIIHHYCLIFRKEEK
jgi:DNA modification methylase